MPNIFGDEEIVEPVENINPFGDEEIVEPVAGSITPTQQPPSKIDMLMQKISSGEVLAPTQQEAIAELQKRNILPQSTMGIPGSQAIGESQGAKGLTREAMPLLRPALETAPAVAMGIAGTPGGPLGQAAGGALGYTAGKKTADAIEKWANTKEGDVQKKTPVIEELGYLGDDLIRGLTFEFGGAALAPILGTLLKTPGFVKNQIASRFPAMGEKEIEKRAAAIIEANTGSNPQYLKNIEASQQVVEEIPNLKATMGDLANDPGLIKLQRGLETQSGIASENELFKRAENIEAVQNYLKQNFPGKEGIDDVLEELTKQKAALAQGTKTAEQTAMTARGKVTPQDPQTTGKKVMEEIKAAKEPVSKIEKEYWDKVPNYKMTTPNTDKVFKEVVDEPSMAQDLMGKYYAKHSQRPKTIKGMQVTDRELNDVIYSQTATPTEKMAAGKVKSALAEDFKVLGEAAEQGDFATYKGDVVHPKQLVKELDELNVKLKSGDDLNPDTIDVKKTYSELENANAIGIMKQIQEGSDSYAKRLAKTYRGKFGKDAPIIPGKERAIVAHNKARKAEIEEILGGAEEAKNAAIAYANAKAFSESQNFGRFGKGVVAELRQSGKYADGMKIPAEARPKKLMSVDSADQFIKAVGKEKAGDIMLRHYADDMMSKVTYDEAGQLQARSLTNWVNKNKRVLERYGIKNYFDSVESAHSSMFNAQKAQNKFNDSIAAKLLDSDPQNAIARAFSGGEGISAKNTGEIMRNLMKRMKGNKKATRALENSFKNFMYETAETTAKSIKDDKVLSNATLSKQMRRFKPAMAVLYRGQPGKIKALQTMEKAIEMQNRTAKAPIGGGSDTAEKGNIIANILGTIVSHTPGVSYAAKLAKLGLGAFKNLNVQATNDMVSRMLHDPELAQIIIRAARKNPNTKKVSSDLSKYMIINGLRQATPKKEQK